MRFTTLCLAVVIAVAIVAHSASPANAAGHDLVSFSILFDLGDGSIFWAPAEAYTSTAPNATWDAVQVAASQLGLWISSSWSASFGVFILDIGNRSPPAGAVGLFVWNTTTHAWDLAPVGISSLVVTQDEAIALSDNAFDPVTYATIPPAATPDSPYPAAEFRGDAVNSGTTGSSAPDGVRVAWDRDVGVQEIESAPVVVNGTVYVLTMDGFFAFNESTGSPVWQNLRVRGLSTPAYANGLLLAGGSDGRLHAVAATNGTELGNVTLLPQTLFSGITSSPKVVFETAYVGTFNESGGLGEVVALWTTNGTIQWRHTAPGSISFSTPAVGDGTVYVGVIGLYNTTTQVTYGPPYGVLALDAANGTQRWFSPLNGSVAASPIFAGSSLFVPSKDGYLYALDPTTGSVQWRRAVSAGVSSPALRGDTLYVAGGSGSFGGPGLVTALNVSTRTTELTFAPNGGVQTAVTWSNGLVFFSTNVANGTIYALDGATGDVVWSYTPSPHQYIFGSPVVADGTVFAPSDNGHIYAIRAPTSLASVNLTGSATLTVGETVPLTVRIVADAGRLVDAALRVTLREAAIVSANTPYASNESSMFGYSYVWDLGTVPFGTTLVFTLQVKGVCPPSLSTMCQSGSMSQLAFVAYNGTVSSDYVDSYAYLSQTVTVPEPLPRDLTLPFILVGGMVAVIVAAAIFLIVTGRRSKRGP